MKTFEIDCELAYEVTSPTDFVFQIEAAQLEGQRVVTENLKIAPALPTRSFSDGQLHNRFFRLHCEGGPLKVHYHATVEVEPLRTEPDAAEVAISRLPDEALRFLVPTRYCESDLLGRTAQRTFGNLAPGYARVKAISEWIRENIEYEIGSSHSGTSARDVLVNRAGVCRDFAHLGIAFCRALNIPARLVVGYVKFEEPPPDFHAVFEAYLGGRWVLFDPTGLAPVENLVRIGTGSDAKDVAFATLFGSATMNSLNPLIEPLADAAQAPSAASTTAATNPA